MTGSAKGKKVFVAMSGGVDSSVAAALLQETGYDVEGITLCFGTRGVPVSDGHLHARRVCETLGISHHVLDVGSDVRDLVIENFMKEYLEGRTPNPCVRCNQHIKFGVLFDEVIRRGADYLATGHYARLRNNEARGCFELLKAADEEKDQTYFLYGIGKDVLPRVLFPLGDKRKDEVRALAHTFGLEAAQRPESQDICFIPREGYQQFIRHRVGDEAFVPGDFKDPSGRVVGRHKGIAHYTIGQRDKLGLALGHPVYVYKIDSATHTVYVGTEESLYASSLTARGFNALCPEILKGKIEVGVKIRYNAPEVKGFGTLTENAWLRVDFAVPQKAVTPGQSVVLTRGDVVLGGAVIDEAFACDPRNSATR